MSEGIFRQGHITHLKGGPDVGRRFTLEHVAEHGFHSVDAGWLERMFPANEKATEQQAEEWAEVNGLVFARNLMDITGQSYIFAPNRNK